MGGLKMLAVLEDSQTGPNRFEIHVDLLESHLDPSDYESPSDQFESHNESRYSPD